MGNKPGGLNVHYRIIVAGRWEITRLHRRKKMVGATSTTKVLLLGRGGTPLGQKNRGTQCPQQDYCRRLMGDAAFVPKNGGLNVHNESIPTQVEGDATRATNLGDSTSTAIKLLPPGDGGCRLCAKKWGTQRPHQKYRHLCKGGPHSGNKKGGTHILQ